MFISGYRPCHPTLTPRHLQIKRRRCFIVNVSSLFHLYIKNKDVATIIKITEVLGFTLDIKKYNYRAFMIKARMVACSVGRLTCFWSEISPCNSDSFQMSDPPASGSQELRLHVSTSSAPFVWYFKLGPGKTKTPESDLLWN